MNGCFVLALKAVALLLVREGLIVCRGGGQLTNLLTTPTVSTWDQFIPNRAWTLINLSPPTALKIQFKGPVTDQNELAFFSRPQWLTCSELAVWSCSSWICQFVCVPALPFISALLHFLVRNYPLFLSCLFHPPW